MDLVSQDQSMAAAPLVSSLPVVDILGRQHQVDGVYHDLATDVVYIFTGMKFYTFEATEFKVSFDYNAIIMKTFAIMLQLTNYFK